MRKIVNPILKKGGRRGYQVYCEIRYEEGLLSIVGVEGPNSSGNCRGSCGQIDMHLREEDRSTWVYQKGWTGELMTKFLDAWKAWHLNDMKETDEKGDWKFVPVPDDVIQFLESLPDTTKIPAWV